MINMVIRDIGRGEEEVMVEEEEPVAEGQVVIVIDA